MKVKAEIVKGCHGWIALYRNDGRTFPMHHHTELEFNLVEHGSGEYLLQDRKYVLHRHDLVWLFPEQEHVLLNRSADFSAWVCKFRPNVLRQVCDTPSKRRLLATNPPDHFCRRLAPAQAEQLATILAGVGSKMNDPTFFNAGLPYALLCAWEAYQTAADQPTSTDVHPAIEKAAHVLREENGALKLAELAQRAGLSESHLGRLFKQQTGSSLVDFRNRQRLERFLRLYGSGQRKTMLAAALEAGFGSYPQFHRVFRRQMGYSPAAHRRAISQHTA